MPELPAFKDWIAPWEKEGEAFDVANFDNDKARRFLHGLLGDKDRLKAQVATLTTERDEATKELTTLKAKDETEVQRLSRELEEARKNPPKAVNKLEIILARGAEKNLTVAQINAAARYVSGETAEEIETNFDTYVEDHGLVGDGKSGDGKGSGPKRQPEQNGKKVTGVDEVDNDVSEDGHFKDPRKALEDLRANR